jgi:DNA-binding CsgD family transcriptional regulator
MLVDPETVVTPFQLELLALYAEGRDYREIGAIKFVSPYTVRNNLLRAQQRVGARNLTHLCVICVDRGLIRKNGVGYQPIQDERVVGE